MKLIKLADRATPEQDFKPIKDVLMRFVEDIENKSYNVKNGSSTACNLVSLTLMASHEDCNGVI
ncbi:hypothetical protein [Paenibacillus lautus]|uniref:hypothetical protein n=1 Tax=Paenibacillus lautus TaxID=1401 RepID=UPI003D27F506